MSKRIIDLETDPNDVYHEDEQMNTETKKEEMYLTVQLSRKHPGKNRIVQWKGKHPHIRIITIEDNLGYGQAVVKLQTEYTNIRNRKNGEIDRTAGAGGFYTKND